MGFFFTAIGHGVGLLADPVTIGLILAGLVWGLVAHALPGISATTALGAVIAFTFNMSADNAVAFMIAILVGTQFGADIPAILLGIPGTPSAVLTATEGYALHKKGQTAKTLSASLASSVSGQFVSMLIFALTVVPLSKAATSFLAPEIFAFTVLGMTSVASLSGKNIFKGLASVTLGVVLSTVGDDPVTGLPRLTFGNVNLTVGLSSIAVLIGLLAIGELVRASRQVYSWEERIGAAKVTMRWPGLSHVRNFIRPMSIGTAVGTVVGALPGASPEIAAYVSYQQAKIFSKHPEEFGHGSMEAVTAVQTAQNAAVGGDLIPTLGMGIPAGPTMILILAALTLHGLEPGPLLSVQSPEVVYASVAGLLGGTLGLCLLGWAMCRFYVRFAMIDRSIVVTVALLLSIVGVFAINDSTFDVMVMVVMGAVGYFMLRYGYSVAAAALGIVLGRLMESSLRQGLILEGGWGGLVSRPITGCVLVASLVLFIYGSYSEYKARRRKVERSGPADTSPEVTEAAQTPVDSSS